MSPSNDLFCSLIWQTVKYFKIQVSKGTRDRTGVKILASHPANLTLIHNTTYNLLITFMSKPKYP